MGRVGAEDSVSWIALNAAPCCSRANTQHSRKTSPEDLPLSYLDSSWTLGRCETCTGAQQRAFEFTRWNAMENCPPNPNLTFFGWVK